MIRSNTVRLAAAALGLSASGASSVMAQADFDAGRDLAANEANAGTELLNPNGAVPEWSYGHRQGSLGPGLTLYSVHDNDPNFQGWREAGSCCGQLSAVLVNTSGIPQAVPDGTIQPLEMLIHPDSDSNDTHAVVRFIVSTTGLYDVAALWEDVDDCCGVGTGGNPNPGGADVYVVHNNVALFVDVVSRETDDTFATSTAYAASSLALTAGDTLEFVVGDAGVLFGDSTRFNATLDLVPEPSSLGLAGLGVWVLVARRRQPA